MSSRRRYPPLAGCRQSTRSNQILTSTGVAEFDTLFGEGVALGTVVLIGQLRYWVTVMV